LVCDVGRALSLSGLDTSVKMVSTRQTVEPTPFVHLMNNVLTSVMYASAFEAWGVTLVTDILPLTNEDIESDFPGTDGATTCLRLMD
jgi:hypothetical protein